MKKILILLAAVLLIAGYSQAQSVPTYVVLPAMSYTDAKINAATLGGHLAFIQSVNDYLDLVANFEVGTKTPGELFWLGIETGDLGFNWSNTDGTESYLNVWTGAFHIGASTQPTGPDQAIVLRKFYAIVSHKVVYRPGVGIGNASDIHRSIVVIDPVVVPLVDPVVAPVDSTPIVVDPTTVTQ